jgi:hypothetical protein
MEVTTMRSTNLLLTVILLGFSLAFVTACDTSSMSGSGAEEHEVTITFQQTPEEAARAQGTFSASGYLQDSGIFEETMFISDSDNGGRFMYGGRMLRGAQGTLAIEYRGVAESGSSLVKGHFTISNGTDAYEPLQGRGEFETWINADVTPAAATGTYTLRWH